MRKRDFTFDAPIGKRMLNSGFGYGVQAKDFWFIPDLNKWMPFDDLPKRYSITNTHEGDGAPKTFRAFKKYLQRHPELNSARVTLCSEFVGCDITAEPMETLK